MMRIQWLEAMRIFTDRRVKLSVMVVNTMAGVVVTSC